MLVRSYNKAFAMFNAELNPQLHFIPANTSTAVSLPLYSAKVGAGQSRFPSAAQDYEQEDLDLNKLVVSNPPATFYCRVSGDSMIDAGLHPNAIVSVDRSIIPKSGDVIVCALDGELLIKRLSKRGQSIKLLSENEKKNYPPIVVKDGQDFIIWGVAAYVVHKIK